MATTPQYVAIFYLKKLTSLNGEATSTHKQYLKKLRKALFEIVLEAHKLHGAEIQDKARLKLSVSPWAYGKGWPQTP
jgi:hypothetical protein